MIKVCPIVIIVLEFYYTNFFAARVSFFFCLHVYCQMYKVCGWMYVFFMIDSECNKVISSELCYFVCFLLLLCHILRLCGWSEMLVFISLERKSKTFSLPRFLLLITRIWYWQKLYIKKFPEKYSKKIIYGNFQWKCMFLPTVNHPRRLNVFINWICSEKMDVNIVNKLKSIQNNVLLQYDSEWSLISLILHRNETLFYYDL